MMFPPKPDIHTYRRTDISVYRVASLLKNVSGYISKVVILNLQITGMN